ncbi:MAG: hypothetical protein BJ554DRAFT_6483, partial [Olpidium bornovanus]
KKKRSRTEVPGQVLPVIRERLLIPSKHERGGGGGAILNSAAATLFFFLRHLLPLSCALSQRDACPGARVLQPSPAVGAAASAAAAAAAADPREDHSRDPPMPRRTAGPTVLPAFAFAGPVGLNSACSPNLQKVPKEKKKKINQVSPACVGLCGGVRLARALFSCRNVFFCFCPAWPR